MFLEGRFFELSSEVQPENKQQQVVLFKQLSLWKGIFLLVLVF